MIKTKYAWSISGVRIKANKLVVSDVSSRIMGTVPVRTARPQRGSNERRGSMIPPTGLAMNHAGLQYLQNWILGFQILWSSGESGAGKR